MDNLRYKVIKEIGEIFLFVIFSLKGGLIIHWKLLIAPNVSRFTMAFM